MRGKKLLALLAIVVVSVVAVGASHGIFVVSDLAASAGIAEIVRVAEAPSGNVIVIPPDRPQPVVPSPPDGATPQPPPVVLHARWYLSGDIAQGCRVMYSEPKNGSYIFVPYQGHIIWIAYNSSGLYPAAGKWRGHIKIMGMSNGDVVLVFIGVFDNRTREFTPHGIAIITKPEQNFTIRARTFSVGRDQYLAFAVYNLFLPWLKINTCNGACYIEKWLYIPCDIRIDDDGSYTGVYEAEVKRFDGEVVFVRGFAERSVTVPVTLTINRYTQS